MYLGGYGYVDGVTNKGLVNRRKAAKMNSITKEELLALKKKYPKGTRVELIEMSDPYRKMEPGLLGTVDQIDDTGTIFVRWDNGSGLGVVYGVDKIRVM